MSRQLWILQFNAGYTVALTRDHPLTVKGKGDWGGFSSGTWKPGEPGSKGSERLRDWEGGGALGCKTGVPKLCAFLVIWSLSFNFDKGSQKAWSQTRLCNLLFFWQWHEGNFVERQGYPLWGELRRGMESQNLPSFSSRAAIATFHAFNLSFGHVCAPLESTFSALTAHGVK